MKPASSLSGAPSFPLQHRLLRLVFAVVWLVLARWTPPPWRGWRTLILKLFGARIGKRSDVRASARIWYPPNLVMGDDSIIAAGVFCYNMDVVTIGGGVVVSFGAQLIGGTHAIDDPRFPLVTRPIVIEEEAWIAAGAVVGPGVRVRARAVLGAHAVTFSSLEPNGVYVGNPARLVRRRTGGASDHAAADRQP